MGNNLRILREYDMLDLPCICAGEPLDRARALKELIGAYGLEGVMVIAHIPINSPERTSLSIHIPADTTTEEGRELYVRMEAFLTATMPSGAPELDLVTGAIRKEWELTTYAIGSGN